MAAAQEAGFGRTAYMPCITSLRYVLQWLASCYLDVLLLSQKNILTHLKSECGEMLYPFWIIRSITINQCSSNVAKLFPAWPTIDYSDQQWLTEACCAPSVYIEHLRVRIHLYQ